MVSQAGNTLICTHTHVYTHTHTHRETVSPHRLGKHRGGSPGRSGHSEISLRWPWLCSCSSLRMDTSGRDGGPEPEWVGVGGGRGEGGVTLI